MHHQYFTCVIHCNKDLLTLCPILLGSTFPYACYTQVSKSILNIKCRDERIRHAFSLTNVQ